MKASQLPMSQHQDQSHRSHAELASLMTSLPAGRIAVLRPGERPQPSGHGWVWRPGVPMLQIVLSGSLVLLDAAGGIEGPHSLGPGDVLVAPPRVWSQRRFDHDRELISLACHPGRISIERYHHRADMGPEGRPVASWSLAPSLPLASATAALFGSVHEAPAATAVLARAMPLLLAAAASAVPLDRCGLARSWLVAHWQEGPSRTSCARALRLHPDHLTRLFRKAGTSWQDELTQLRLQRARDLLLAGATVRAVAVDCGWATASHFIEVFRQHHHVPPNRWRCDILAAL